MYKKGQYIVYRRDVCKIKDIKENKDNNTYYVITPIDDESLIINVPIEDKTGVLRDIIPPQKAKEIISKIKEIEPLNNINDKNLETTYKELLNTNDYLNFIKIIKTTYLRNKNRINNKKKISEKDNTFFILAEKYLYNELAISLNMSVEEVKDYISKVVNE